MHTVRGSAPRLRHRTPVEAHSLRLYERHSADGPHQPASQALRVLDRERRPPQEFVGNRRGHRCRQDELDLVRDRRRDPRRDPAPQEDAAYSWDPRRGGCGNSHRQHVRSVRARRGCGSRPAPSGPTRLLDPLDHLRGHRPRPDRGRRLRGCVVRRYERSFTRLCGQNRHRHQSRTRK